MNVNNKFTIKNGVLLANNFFENNQPTFDPSGWWLSEKYDGERAIWQTIWSNSNGNDNNNDKLWTRQANPINAPDWFIELLKESDGLCLDGELWLGRERFEDTGIFRTRIPNHRQWVNAKYMIFDIPNLNMLFEERMNILNDLIEKINIKWRNDIIIPFNIKKPEKSPIRMVKQIKIESLKEFNMIYNNLLNDAAEGAMLRKPNSPYIQQRSDILLKCRPVDDAEAMIIGYNLGKNKNANRLGAFIVKNIKGDNLESFNISGMKDSTRDDYEKTHPIGTIITYRYRGLYNSGIPRLPTYYRIYKN